MDPTTVKAKGGEVIMGKGRSEVALSPIRSVPDGARLTGVPEIVIPGLPSMSLVPPMAKPVGLGESVRGQ